MDLNSVQEQVRQHIAKNNNLITYPEQDSSFAYIKDAI